jgi:hypothetical protein
VEWPTAFVIVAIVFAVTAIVTSVIATRKLDTSAA